MQARSHLEALPGFERVRIASRSREHAETLATEAGAELCGSVRETYERIDVPGRLRSTLCTNGLSLIIVSTLCRRRE